MRAIITEEIVNDEKLFKIYIYGKGISSSFECKSINIDNGIKSFNIESIPHGREDCEKAPILRML